MTARPAERTPFGGPLKKRPDRGVDLVVLHVHDCRIYGAASPISARFVTDARDGFASLVLGSVSQQVATHAAGPVVVVRGRSDPTGPVVVGVDGSAGADEALRLAFEGAAIRGIGVLAVRAYSPAVPPWGLGALPYVEDVNERREAERAALAEDVALWQDKFPDVPGRVGRPRWAPDRGAGRCVRQGEPARRRDPRSRPFRLTAAWLGRRGRTAPMPIARF